MRHPDSIQSPLVYKEIWGLDFHYNTSIPGTWLQRTPSGFRAWAGRLLVREIPYTDVLGCVLGADV